MYISDPIEIMNSQMESQIDLLDEKMTYPYVMTI